MVVKKILFVCLLCLPTAPLLAADLGAKPSAPGAAPSLTTPEPAMIWAGFYTGVNGGSAASGWSKADLSPVLNSDGTSIKAQLRRSGGLGGMQAGYQLQSGALVYGLEADIAIGDIRGKQSADGVLNAAPAKARLEAQTSMFGTLRARVGFAYDRLHIYGTAGAAAAEQKSSLTTTTTANGLTSSYTGTASSIYAGWAMGAGIEYALTRNINARVEYLYANVGEGLRGSTDAGALHVVRSGVNYRF